MPTARSIFATGRRYKNATGCSIFAAGRFPPGPPPQHVRAETAATLRHVSETVAHAEPVDKVTRGSLNRRCNLAHQLQQDTVATGTHARKNHDMCEGRATRTVCQLGELVATMIGAADPGAIIVKPTH